MDNGLLIQGNNVHVFKFIDAAPYEIVCGTDVTIEIEQELIGATTPESGLYPEVRPRLRRAKMNISGVTTSTNDGDLSVFHFLDEDIFGSVQDMQIVFTDNNGSDRTIRGDFYIERLPITGTSGEMSTYEIELKSSGAYTVSTLTDPVVSGESVTSDSYVVSGGVIQDNAWAGLTIANFIEVCREGSEQLSLGLPFTFDEPTRTITPDAGTTIDGQRMFVIWTY